MHSALRKAGNYVTRSIAGETIVVPIRAHVAELDSVYVLNEVAAAIWKTLDQGLGSSEIAATIAEEFDVPEATARVDVERFLETLLGAGVLELEA